MQYWLIKSEPDVFSFADLQRVGREPWNGVRNYQARNFLRQMRVGDLCLFYHSNAKPPGVVGVARVQSADADARVEVVEQIHGEQDEDEDGRDGAQRLGEDGTHREECSSVAVASRLFALTRASRSKRSLATRITISYGSANFRAHQYPNRMSNEV